MTLRQRIAARNEFIAGLTELALFIDSRPKLAALLQDAVREMMTFWVRSKAEADEVIKAYSARPLWRNGYYMAEWNAGMVEWPGGVRPQLPLGVSERTGRDFTFELHFAPLITEDCDANVRSAGGEG